MNNHPAKKICPRCGYPEEIDRNSAISPTYRCCLKADRIGPRDPKLWAKWYEEKRARLGLPPTPIEGEEP